jgi:hypothetical protein
LSDGGIVVRKANWDNRQLIVL